MEVVDLALLAKTIDDSGLKREFIAEKLGITRQALAMKISGTSEFSASELSKMKMILRLSRADFRRIFFASQVEAKSTKRN